MCRLFLKSASLYVELHMTATDIDPVPSAIPICMPPFWMEKPVGQSCRVVWGELALALSLAKTKKMSCLELLFQTTGRLLLREETY